MEDNLLAEKLSKEWKKLKWDLNKDRYKVYKGFVFDRLIFRGAFYFILLFFFVLAYVNGFDLDYFYCDSKPNAFYRGGSSIEEVVQECKNPFYRPGYWKNEEYLPPGEYGVNIGLSYNLWVTILSTFLFAFGLNGLVHYKKRRGGLNGH